MKSTGPISSSGTAMPIKEEQGLEAPELTLAKSSVLDTTEKEPVTTSDVKENASVVKDLPDALKSMHELFGLSATLSNFTCHFNELQQHMEGIAKSIDSLYKLQNIKESKVVVTTSKPNASTSGSSPASVLTSSKQIDKSSDSTHKLQNTKESQVVMMVPEPNASTSASYGAPVLSSSEQIDKSIDNTHKLQNTKETQVVMMVPEPNASTSASYGALVLSSSKQIDKSIDNTHKLQNTKESQGVMMVPEPNASTSASYDAPVLSSSNQIDKSTDNIYKLQNNESKVVVTVPEPNALISGSFGAPVLSSSNQVDKSIDIKESEVVMVVPEPNVSTSRSPGPPVLPSSNQIDKSIDNMQKLQNVKESEVVVIAPKPNASTSRSSGPPVLSSSNPVVRNANNGKSRKKGSCAVLEVLCRDMASRGFRKYIQSELSDIEKIREEATTALKCAPDPAKLVLKSIGRFYINPSKSYSKNSPAIISRDASLLILEIFLLSNCSHIEPSIKKEAELGAINWRKRLIREGGFSKAGIEDARGLLLFVASYGIPSVFSNEDLIELIRLSNAREIANVLEQSHFLRERICDIIQGMVGKKMYMKAVEVAYSFGIKEKYPPESILSSFLQEAKEACKTTTLSKCSPEALKEANEKKLAAFRSVAKCLEDYKIAPAKLAGCSIHAEIAELEKVISDLGREIGGKRDAYVNDNNVIEFGGNRKAHVPAELEKVISDLGREIGGKRDAYVNDNNVIEFGGKRKAHVPAFVKSKAKHPRTSSVVTPQVHNTFTLHQEQKTCGLTNGSTFNDGRSSQFTGFSHVSSAMGSAPSGSAESGALHRTLPGNFAEASIAHAAGSGGVFNAAPPVHFANGGAGSHAWHGNGALNDNSQRRQFIGNLTFDGDSRGLPRPISAMEQGFPGHPSTSIGVGNRNPGASLYKFADSF